MESYLLSFVSFKMFLFSVEHCDFFLTNFQDKKVINYTLLLLYLWMHKLTLYRLSHCTSIKRISEQYIYQKKATNLIIEQYTRLFWR